VKKTISLALLGLVALTLNGKGQSTPVPSDRVMPISYPWDVLDRAQERSLDNYEAGLGPYLDHVWPIGGTATPDFPLSDTYGPRIKTSEGRRYDWHRGIDIPAAENTPVRAIAAGTVRIAGEHDRYEDSLVQLQHTKSDGSGFYFSNYMHLNGWCVAEGDAVSQGDVIGYSGCSTSHYGHLHFEIRDGNLWQKDCVHPMAAMPYDDLSAPDVAIDNVDWTIPSAPVVQVTVSVSVDELDLRAVEIVMYRRVKVSPRLYSYQEVDSQRFDIMHRTYCHTPTNNANLYLDEADFGSMQVRPAEYSAGATTWELTLTFEGLHGIGNIADQAIRAYAEDVNGNTGSDSLNIPPATLRIP
jgi:murein DD-endopeptidase MepM/ murein hydrolase activator NlpD